MKEEVGIVFQCQEEADVNTNDKNVPAYQMIQTSRH